MTNFAGWFLVPLVVILVFELIVRAKRSEVENRIGLRTFLNPLFYLSIALFNIAITMWIGEPLLASIDCMLLIPVVGLLMWRIKRQMNT